MVSRKSSLPYPTSPPPPPPTFAPPLSNHNIDTSDLPPIPAAMSRRTASPYQEMNPWEDSVNYTQAHSNAEVPDILKPAGGRGTSPGKPFSQQPADIMRPGWSGENTPRSSLDSHRSKDFWESSDDEREVNKSSKKQNKQDATSHTVQEPEVPASLQIRRKPVGHSPTQVQASFESNHDLASNNPFRRRQSSTHQEFDSSIWNTSDKGKGKEKEVEKYDAPSTYHHTDGWTNGSTVPDLSAYNSEHIRSDNAHWDAPQVVPPPPPTVAPPPVPSQLPPPVPEVISPFSSQPPLIPVSSEQEKNLNPWSGTPNISASPSPIPFAPSQKQASEYNEDLLDRGHRKGSVSLGDELQALPNHAPNSSSQQSLLDDTEIAPALPIRSYKQNDEEIYVPPPGPPPSHVKSRMANNDLSVFDDEMPPTKPPRPAIVTKLPTEQELAQMQEQRSETYQIKHFNWFDHRLGKMRSSSMLMQNKNGPCPLLALVNALILGATDQDQAMLDEFLRTREQVTLGTIIENLMMELLARSADGELPDVDELNRFLLKLRTGMNMNPRFVQPPKPAPNLMDARDSMLHLPTQEQTPDMPGGFESTQDVRLYNSFSIQTMHGWLPEPSSDAANAFARSAQTYEDAQAKLFGEDELEYRLSTNGLTPQEQVIWEDINSIKNFLNTYQSQLTLYGLQCIRSYMLPGSFGILFRNDHFSTIYKHPRDSKLYTLVTDAGFADQEEIWQSLVDTSGQDSAFFSGDFKAVNHNLSSGRRDSSRHHSGQLDVNIPAHLQTPMSPQEQQEQSDADYAMALQMQLEEEEDQRRRRAQSQSQSQPNNPTGRQSGGRRSTSGNIPIPLRSNNSSQEVRPLIPARNARSSMPAVNRPADANAADAPPAYEEAARDQPYNPPIGSPLHPQSSPTPDSSPFNSSSQINLHAPSSNTNRPQTSNRRTSAYHENLERQNLRPGLTTTNTGRYEMGMSPAYEFTDGRMPGSYIHSGYGGHGQSVASGSNGSVLVPPNRLNRNNNSVDRDRDCVVM